MNYIEIDFNKVKGYNNLSDPAKSVFKRVYTAHNASHGSEYKEKWIPVKVTEHKDHLKVYFKNGEWLHYRPYGSWD